jgi:hypothetical protein
MSYKEKLNKIHKEAVIPKIVDEATKMFSQGFEINTAKAQLKNKHPSISVVDINDSVDRAFSDMGYKSYKERLNNFKEKFTFDKYLNEVGVDSNKFKSQNPKGYEKYKQLYNKYKVEDFETNYGYLDDLKDEYNKIKIESYKGGLNSFKEGVIGIKTSKGGKYKLELIQDSNGFSINTYVNNSLRGSNYLGNKISLDDAKKKFEDEIKDWKEVNMINLESHNKKESLTLDDVAIQKYKKNFKDLTPEEKKYVNYVYAEWSDDSWLDGSYDEGCKGYKERLNRFKETDTTITLPSGNKIVAALSGSGKKATNLETGEVYELIDNKWIKANVRPEFQEIKGKVVIITHETKEDAEKTFKQATKKGLPAERESFKEGYVQITGPYNIPKTKARLQQLCNDFGLQMSNEGRIDFNENRSLLKREINEFLGELKNLNVSYTLKESFRERLNKLTK